MHPSQSQPPLLLSLQDCSLRSKVLESKEALWVIKVTQEAGDRVGLINMSGSRLLPLMAHVSYYRYLALLESAHGRCSVGQVLPRYYDTPDIWPRCGGALAE